MRADADTREELAAGLHCTIANANMAEAIRKLSLARGLRRARVTAWSASAAPADSIACRHRARARHAAHSSPPATPACSVGLRHGGRADGWHGEARRRSTSALDAAAALAASRRPPRPPGTGGGGRSGDEGITAGRHGRRPLPRPPLRRAEQRHHRSSPRRRRLRRRVRAAAPRSSTASPSPTARSRFAPSRVEATGTMPKPPTTRRRGGAPADPGRCAGRAPILAATGATRPSSTARTSRGRRRHRRAGHHRRVHRHHRRSSPDGQPRSSDGLDHRARGRSAGIRRTRPAPARRAPDPITLEVFNNLLHRHRRADGQSRCSAPRSPPTSRSGSTSPAPSSTPAGGLVANAPHIPVHLGAMGDMRRRSSTAVPDLRPGDVLVTNDPYRRRLRTCPTSRWSRRSSTRRAAPALLHREPRTPRRDRRHHAGLDAAVLAHRWRRKAWCSAPSGSSTAAASTRRPSGRARARAVPYPSRAGREPRRPRGADRRQPDGRAAPGSALVGRAGPDVVAPTWATCSTRPKPSARGASPRCPTGDHRFDRLPRRRHAHRASRIRRRRATQATVDFTGTGPVTAGNLNAPPRRHRSAVLYVAAATPGRARPSRSTPAASAPVEIVVPAGSPPRPRRPDARASPAATWRPASASSTSSSARSARWPRARAR